MARNQRLRTSLHPFVPAALLTLAGCAGAAMPLGTPSGSEPARIRVSEGTALYFDLAPDGSHFVFDLLGQLWELPLAGGDARPLTSASQEAAEDRHPAIAPGGRWIATRSDRPGGRGIWLHDRSGGPARLLTDSALLLYGDVGVPAWSPDGGRIAYAATDGIRVLPTAGGPTLLLPSDSDGGVFDEPDWAPGGDRLLVSGPWEEPPRGPLESPAGAAIWELSLETGTAQPVTPPGTLARAPAWSPDGRSIAYFAAGEAGTFRLQVQTEGGAPRVLLEDADLEPRRVRWSPDGGTLYYIAAGRLRRVPATGGPSVEIPFVAELRLPERGPHPVALRLPQPGETVAARGFSGLALAPDGRRFALLALGRLWLIDPRGSPRELAEVHETATDVAWSPDGRWLVWSAAPEGEADLWLLEVAGGRPGRLTELAGAETRPSWSPDGRWIAFVHWPAEGADGGPSLRVVPSERAGGRGAEPLDLGPLPWDEVSAFASAPGWTAGSDSILIFGGHGWPVTDRRCAEAILVSLSGERAPVERFPCRPAHVTLERTGSLLAVEEGEVVRRPRVPGGWGQPVWRGGEAALHPTSSATGDVLFAGSEGLRLRGADGAELGIGWPLDYRTPEAQPLLLRNVRVVAPAADGVLRDLLLVNGRIRTVAPAGVLPAGGGTGAAELDGGGRWVLPGLIDTHVHLTGSGHAVLRAALYHGVTTVREMGAPLGLAAALRDLQAAGAPGARLVVSGTRVYPTPTGASLTSDVLWIPADPSTGDRLLALLRAFGAGHVKMRYVQRWGAGADLVRAAGAAGLPVGGHCGHAVLLAAAGPATLEHADGQCGDWEFGVRDDVVQLLRGTGVSIVPMIDLHRPESHPDPARLEAPGIAPFLTPALRAWLLRPPEDSAAARRRERRAVEATRRLAAGGVRIAIGTDAELFPEAIHRELEALVRAGLTPSAALRAATTDAAAVLGLGHELGLVRAGYRADLLIVDGDPTVDVRAARRVWAVIQDGRLVDRAALREPQGSGRTVP
jgi:imidazolonepropionase-like amidohydrolase/Tol biopolymer transport system component